MPRGDGTGPWWAGGAWGCRRGPGGMGYGRGFGPGMGRGRFYGPQYGQYSQPYAAQPQQESASEMKAYADSLAFELEEVRKRIAALEKK